MSKQKLRGTNGKIILLTCKVFIDQGLTRSMQPTL